MKRRSLEKKILVDSVVVIIDTGGMRMRQVSAEFISLMKMVAGEFMKYQLFIIIIVIFTSMIKV
jgi:hypothetical protein